MNVITESVRGITIHWPKGMPLAYMTKVLEHLAYDRYIKEWSYVGGKWANLGRFEFKSLDGTDSGRMLEGDRVFVAKSLVKELGITQRLWMEDGAVEYGPREIVLARVYNPDDVDDLQSLVVFGHEVEIEKNGVLVNGHSVLNSLVVEYLGREGEDHVRYLRWVNDEDYWLKEIVGAGERLLPADCFGNPIVSKGE